MPGSIPPPPSFPVCSAHAAGWLRAQAWPALLVPVLLALLLAGCAAPRAHGDWWAVRSSPGDDPAHIASISHVNSGKPPRQAPVAPVVLRERRRGDASVVLRYDQPLADDWASPDDRFDRELDKALAWLGRLTARGGNTLRQPASRPARLIVTLVDDQAALDVTAPHPSSDSVTIELYVAIASGAPSQSASVGKALATGLHEAAHALGDRAPGSRLRDETRASQVEACFLIDTLRPGDRLDLAIAPDPAETDHFATTQSRRATTAVMQALRGRLGQASLKAGDAAGRRRLADYCTAVAATLALESDPGVQ